MRSKIWTRLIEGMNEIQDLDKVEGMNEIQDLDKVEGMNEIQDLDVAENTSAFRNIFNIQVLTNYRYKSEFIC
jgi:hypothetical protein